MDVVAGWPGRVAEVNVAVGDQVAVDDELVTIESMKMLMPVMAPVAGRVSEICVAVDQAVNEGETILRLDA
ncbi:MAG: acetyl-CoA carboxylase biotin carboxyl carrier protein subunit [Dehalococcoidia bacterium]|nr:MAG: acetyl-CoA carboxylase biotin carboxyl carrier protein subunit [Dehalococcoidia bacterium]